MPFLGTAEDTEVNLDKDKSALIGSLESGTWEEQPIILNLHNFPLDINYAPCPSLLFTNK